MENESIKERLNSRNSIQVRESKKMVRPLSLTFDEAGPTEGSFECNCRIRINRSIGDRLLFVVCT